MLSISNSCLKAIFNHTTINLPNESCGVITSYPDTPNLLSHFYPITNRHPYPRHHFIYDTQEWIDVNMKIRQDHQFISCYVHSHIQASPLLSNEDLNHIHDRSALQMIVHYTEKNSPSIHLYRFNERTGIYDNCSLMPT